MQVKFMERLTFGHGQIDEHLSLKPYYDTSLPLVSLQKTSIYYLIFFFLGLTTRLPCALANLARFFSFLVICLLNFREVSSWNKRPFSLEKSLNTAKFSILTLGRVSLPSSGVSS